MGGAGTYGERSQLKRWGFHREACGGCRVDEHPHRGCRAAGWGSWIAASEEPRTVLDMVKIEAAGEDTTCQGGHTRAGERWLVPHECL